MYHWMQKKGPSLVGQPQNPEYVCSVLEYFDRDVSFRIGFDVGRQGAQLARGAVQLGIKAGIVDQPAERALPTIYFFENRLQWTE
jgi:hypothetical protein